MHDPKLHEKVLSGSSSADWIYFLVNWWCWRDLRNVYVGCYACGGFKGSEVCHPGSSEEYSIKKLRRMSFYCFYPLGACHIIFCTFFIVFGYVLHCQVQIEVWHFETTYFIGVTAKNDTFNENKPTMWDFLTVTLLLVWHWEQMLITLEQNWIRKNLRPSRAFPIWLNWTCNSVLKMVFYNWNCSFVALLSPTHMLTGAY